MQFKFPPKLRIKKRSDFVELQEKGQKLFSRNFLIIVNSSQLENSRFGVTITTKVDKRAVKRNKLKRRLREIFRLTHNKFKVPIDLIVIARNDATELTFAEVKRQILGTLKNKGFLKFY